MSSRGFITLGIDSEVDQIKYSYALALSIKQCDPSAEVCLVIDEGKTDELKQEYKDTFDYVVELPYGNTGSIDGIHASNFWQMIHCTPFDETIYVDSDVLFNHVDIDLLWDTFADRDIAMPSTALTYRTTPLGKDHKFYLETHFGLPTNFGNMIYFKRKSKVALSWFKMADAVFQNWEELYAAKFSERSPEFFEKNFLINVITSMMDMNNDVQIDIPYYYDMYSKGQGFWDNSESIDWVNELNHWYTSDGTLIIENSSISKGIIHYRNRAFITEGIIDVIKSTTNS